MGAVISLADDVVPDAPVVPAHPESAWPSSAMLLPQAVIGAEIGAVTSDVGAVSADAIPAPMIQVPAMKTPA
jgi:hypothetical protein